MTKLTELQQTIDELRQSNKELRERERLATILSLEKDLNIASSNVTSGLTTYVELLERAFRIQRLDVTSEMVTQLREDHVFSEWKASDASSVLLLSGRMQHNPRHHSHCWLSLAAGKIFQSFVAAESQQAVYLCQTISSDGYDDPVDPFTILWGIVYQMFTWQPKLLDNTKLLARIRNKKNHCGEQITSESSSHLTPTGLEDVGEVIADCLEMISGDKPLPQYILIDRIDRTKNDLVNDLLAVLLKLTYPSRSVLKILVVSHASFWDPSEEEIERIKNHHRIQDASYLIKRDWTPKLRKRHVKG